MQYVELNQEKAEHTPVIRNLFEIWMLGYSQERREQMLYNFWKSLSDDDLDLISEDLDLNFLTTIGIISILKSNEPLDFKEIEYDESIMPSYCKSTRMIALLESLKRKGLIKSSREFFYNPLVDDDTQFISINSNIKLLTDEERLNYMI